MTPPNKELQQTKRIDGATLAPLASFMCASQLIPTVKPQHIAPRWYSAASTERDTMRTLLSIAVFGAFFTLSCAGVATGLDNRSPQTEEQRVLAVEDEYASAELNRDEAALRRLVDDRFLLNSSDGSSSGKEALIRSVLGMNMTGQTNL